MLYARRMSAIRDSHDHTVASPPRLGRDHSQCAHNPVGAGVKLTGSRQRVLDELCAAGRPVGAYEMIDLLAKDTGKRAAPISIYRALDFLVDSGLVHRLASRNAFLACAHGHGEREPVVFLICDDCGAVFEATSARVNRGLAAVANDNGFTPRAQVIEVTGRCAKCPST